MPSGISPMSWMNTPGSLDTIRTRAWGSMESSMSRKNSGCSSIIFIGRPASIIFNEVERKPP